MRPLFPVSLQLVACGNSTCHTGTGYAFVVASNVDRLFLISMEDHVLLELKKLIPKGP